MVQNSLRATEAPASAVPATPSKPSRLFFVDHLRAALMILVVLHHVALVYGASVPGYYYVEPPFNDASAFQTLLVFVLLNQGWFMGAFFLLSGYFTPRSYDRKGAGAFLRDRLIRLGIPLLLFTFVLSPLSNIGVFLMPSSLTGLTSGPTWQDYPNMLGFGPLWFVALLLIFSFGYVIWRKLTENRTASPTPEAAFPGYVTIGVFVLALALVTFLFRMIVPIGQSVWQFPTLAYLPQYLSFFVVGMIASRRDWFRKLPDTLGIVGFVTALLAVVILFPLGISGQLFSLEITSAVDNAMGNGHIQSAAYALWDSLFAVGLCLGFLMLFRRVFNAEGWFGNFLAQHSYAVYVIHIPIIVFLAYGLRNLDLESLLKCVAVSIIVVPLCYIAATIVRKIPYAMRVF